MTYVDLNTETVIQNNSKKIVAHYATKEADFAIFNYIPVSHRKDLHYANVNLVIHYKDNTTSEHYFRVSSMKYLDDTWLPAVHYSRAADLIGTDFIAYTTYGKQNSLYFHTISQDDIDNASVKFEAAQRERELPTKQTSYGNYGREVTVITKEVEITRYTRAFKCFDNYYGWTVLSDEVDCDMSYDSKHLCYDPRPKTVINYKETKDGEAKVATAEELVTLTGEKYNSIINALYSSKITKSWEPIGNIWLSCELNFENTNMFYSRAFENRKSIIAKEHSYFKRHNCFSGKFMSYDDNVKVQLISWAKSI